MPPKEFTRAGPVLHPSFAPSSWSPIRRGPRLFGKTLHLLRHDPEAFAVLACLRRLDRRIDGQQVRLRGE